MRQLLVLAGIMLPVALAVPSTVHSSLSPRNDVIPASALPFLTFDMRDLDAADLAIRHALRDLIPAYNISVPRAVSVNRSHGLANTKQTVPNQLETENGKCVATCMRTGTKMAPISAKVHVDYDDHEYGFDKNLDKPDDMINVEGAVKTYVQGSTLADNLLSAQCSATRGSYTPVDDPDECCYIHWSWIQQMGYDDTIHKYKFPDPLASMNTDTQVIAYVVCFDVTAGTSCSTATIMHRTECTFEQILWDTNKPPVSV